MGASNSVKDRFSSNEYWTGPYGIQIPNYIEYITSKDGGNTLYKSGGETEMGCCNPPTEEEYKQKYCKLLNGVYYWK